MYQRTTISLFNLLNIFNKIRFCYVVFGNMPHSYSDLEMFTYSSQLVNNMQLAVNKGVVNNTYIFTIPKTLTAGYYSKYL